MKLRWMDLHIIKGEVVPRVFKLKNLYGSINASIVNGHMLKPYHGPVDLEEVSSDLLSNQTTPIEVNWSHKKTSHSKDMLAKLKKSKKF